MLVKKQEGRRKPINTLMTVGEVATYLAVHERTVYRLVKEGHMPAYRVGGQWRFKAAVLEEWICGPQAVASTNATCSK